MTRRSDCFTAGVLAVALTAAICHAAAEQNGKYRRAFTKAYAYFVRADRERSRAISLFEKTISLDPGNPRNLEAEYYIAKMWGGDCQPDEQVDLEKYVACMERIFRKYEDRRKSYWYLRLRVPYAQLLAEKDPAKAKDILWSIIRLSPDEIDAPDRGRFWQTRDHAVEKIKTGAVWALMHEETRRLRVGPKAEQEAKVLVKAAAVREQIARDEQAKQWLPWADWWVRVIKADKIKDVPRPRRYRSRPDTQPAEPLTESAVDYLRRRGRLKQMFSDVRKPSSRPSTAPARKDFRDLKASWVARDTPTPVAEVGQESGGLETWLCVVAAGAATAGTFLLARTYYATRRRNKAS